MVREPFVVTRPNVESLAGHVAPVPLALERFTTRLLPRLIVATFLLSFVPFSKTRYIGTGGEPWLSVIAPVILIISTGLVILMWWILAIIVAGLKAVASRLPARSVPFFSSCLITDIHLCQGHRQSDSRWRITQYDCFHSRCLSVDSGVYTVAGGISWMLDPSPFHLRVFSSTKG